MRRFLFRLALLLGKTVGEIEAMPSRELSEWLAYAQVEPLPDPHLSAGIIAHTVASSNWPGKGPRPKLDDYIPKPRITAAATTPEEAAAMLIKQLGAIPKG